MSKNKVKVESDGNLIRIGDAWYQFESNPDADFKTGEFILRKVNRKEIDRKTEFISKKFFSFIDPKLVLKDALKELPDGNLDRLYKYVKKHKEAKPKIIKDCIAMKIAGLQIPIRG